MKRKHVIEVEDGREIDSRMLGAGRPRAMRRSRLGIHAGIEKALYKAAVEPGFRRELLEDRFAALRGSGIGLTEAEAAILSSVPDERLALMIDRIRPEKHGKRRFMRAVATAVVTLATGTAAISCDKDVTADAEVSDAGIDPDVPSDIVDEDALDDAADIPEGIDEEDADIVDLDTDDVAVGGIMPDVPIDESGDEG